jgi:hypothetical protein
LENGCVAEALARQRAATPPGLTGKAELLRFLFEWFLRWSGGELSKMGRLLHLPLDLWEQHELKVWLAESPARASLLLLFLIQSNRAVEAVQALRRFEQVRKARQLHASVHAHPHAHLHERTRHTSMHSRDWRPQADVALHAAVREVVEGYESSIPSAAFRALSAQAPPPRPPAPMAAAEATAPRAPALAFMEDEV